MGKSMLSDSMRKWKDPKELAGKVVEGQGGEEDLGQWVRPAEGSSERRATQNSHDDQEGSRDKCGKETTEVPVKLSKVVNKAAEEIQAAKR